MGMVVTEQEQLSAFMWPHPRHGCCYAAVYPSKLHLKLTWHTSPSGSSTPGGQLLWTCRCKLCGIMNSHSFAA